MLPNGRAWTRRGLIASQRHTTPNVIGPLGAYEGPALYGPGLRFIARYALAAVRLSDGQAGCLDRRALEIGSAVETFSDAPLMALHIGTQLANASPSSQAYLVSRSSLPTLRCKSGGRGKSIVKTHPVPGRSRTWMVPPFASTLRCAIESPK